MRINLDIFDLEIFLAVKETGSFHQAAEQLGLSQSAVTRRIKKLEDELQSVLFERTTRAVHPTLAAKRLEARAESIVADVRETALAMRDASVAHAYQRNALVTVALVPTILSKLMIKAIDHLRQQGQAPRIRLLDLSANEVAEAVSKGEADFGISSLPSLEPNIDFEPLVADRIALAMPLSHPLAGREVIRWADLEGEDLIVPARGMGNRLLIDEAFASQRVALGWTYEVNRTTSALEMVAHGIGLALVPQSAAETAQSFGVQMRAMADTVISRPIGLITRSGQRQTDAASALMQALRSVASGQ